MGSDRRIAKRITCQSAIRYQLPDVKDFTNTIARNISDTGIGFISNEFIPKSSHLILELNEPRYNKYMRASGEIVWISSQPHSERFYVGARFMEPPVEI